MNQNNQGQFNNNLKNDLRRVCPKCNAQVAFTDSFCSKCLTKMVRSKEDDGSKEKICKICQTVNPNDAEVCRICDVKFK